MADKDEILLNFQAITGMEDIPMCLDILEQKEWDLTAALKGVMPPDDFSCASSNGPGKSQGAKKGHDEFIIDLTQDRDFSVPIQESQGSKCSLGVYYKERLIQLDLSLDTQLVQVKNHLEADTGIPSSEQVLSGWPERAQKQVEDHMTLAQMGVVGDIYHIRMDHQHPSHYSSLPPSHLSPQSLKRYNELPPPPYSEVVLQGSRSADEVGGATLLIPEGKASSDVRSMSVDPGSVDDQLSSQGSWGVSSEGPPKKGDVSGEGEGVAGGGGGGGSGGGDGKEVESPDVVEITNSQEVPSQNDVVEIPDGSESSHYSDCEAEQDFVDDDDLYVDTASNVTALREPLVPEDCTEPYEALQCFTHSFELRYGAMHPLFLLGSLSEAVLEATIGTASSGMRKPLLVYLHHDGSVLSNVFCSQLLCSESVVNYLSLNFISWAWDLTHHPHRLKLLQMIEETLGASGKTQVNEIDEKQLPVILLAYKEKGSIGIKEMIQGSTSLDKLMTTLISTVEQHNYIVQREVQDEHERLMRETMIAEQNRAYEESLMADQEKERKKKEQAIEEEEQRQCKEAVRRALSESVPEEPPADSDDKVCTFRLRYPDGEVGQRRFLASHTLEDLFNFVGSKNYLVDKYRILTGFPRKDLSEQDVQLTLEDLKLYPQETLIIEERT